jgi:predicted dehydrogenase
MSRLRIAVVGVGHLGKEHARILAGMDQVELVGVADVNLEQARAVAKSCGTQAFADYWPLLNLVDAACIVVPTVHHRPVAADFLRRGISLLVEKPLAPTSSEALALVQLAENNQCVLQVGHIERFNPAFEELKRRPIQPKIIRAQRVGPFTGRSTDIGVVLDLMVHDLDLILDLVQAPASSVEAVGLSMFGTHEDYANARIHFANGCIAEVTASRTSAAAQRVMEIWGPEGRAEVDFAQRRVTLLQPSQHVRTHGLDPAKLDPVTRARLRDELFTRHLEMTAIDGQSRDQLTAELVHFTECVHAGATPRCSGRDAMRTITLAEQILDSLRRHRWDGEESGPTGPLHLPSPKGLLFPHRVGQEAA